MHSGQERRLCLHEEIGLHFFRGLERGDFTECRRHYTKGRQQTPCVQEHGLCLTLTDQELFASACSGLPREGGTPMRDGCQTYLATLGRPLGCQKAWELRGVAVFRKLDWRLESEALKRSLLEYALIFYKHWTEMKLDKHSQLRIVHHLLDQVSRQLHFVQGKDVASPTSSQKKKDEVASLDFEMREPRPFTPAAGPIELRLKILIIKSNWCFAAARSIQPWRRSRDLLPFGRRCWWAVTGRSWFGHCSSNNNSSSTREVELWPSQHRWPLQLVFLEQG